MYQLILVDDDEILLEGLSSSFDWHQLKVHVIATATNGLMAIEQLRQHPCDILLTDVRMGRMDGIELTKMVREEFPCLKVIMMSAYQDFSYVHQAIHLGIEDYIVKPIELNQLVITVGDVVQLLEEERTKDRQVQNLCKNLEVLGESTLEDFSRASSMMNLALLDHLVRMILMGCEMETITDCERLGQQLKHTDGDSTLLLLSSIGLLFGRLNQTKLEPKDIDYLKAMQKNALQQPDINVAWQLVTNSLKDIARIVRERSGKGGEQLVRGACRYIDEHFANANLRIKDVAAHVGLSVSYLSTQILKFEHENFTDYLVRRRMIEAQRLLSHTDLRTYEVAYSVGFDNPTYFSTTFKKFTGMTVSKYREFFCSNDMAQQ